MSDKISSICVYAASSSRLNPVYLEEAALLGRAMAERGIALITGGGCMGLMAAIEDSALNAGGRVIGVIPQFMVNAGWVHKGLTETVVTMDMHERKQSMATLADAFVALPGGIGTFEELLEIITWKQLGLCTKPIVILNVNHYYDSLLEQLKMSIEQGFLDSRYSALWSVAERALDVIDIIDGMPDWDNNIKKLP